VLICTETIMVRDILPAVLLAALVAPPATVHAELSASQTSTIEQKLINAYRARNSKAVFQSVNRLISRADSQVIAEIEEYLQRQAHPSLGRMLLAARLANTQTGGRVLVPKPKPREALLTLAALREAIDAVMRDINASHVVSPDAGEKMGIAAFERAFHSIRESQQQAGFAAELAEYLPKLALIAQPIRARLNGEKLAILDADHTAFAQECTELHRRTQEREIELSLQRLELAQQILSGQHHLKERLLAAHAIDYDGWLLTNLFEEWAEGTAELLMCDNLNDPQLPEHTANLIEQGRAAAGELMGKSRLFFAAIHWWLRGRYGSGPMFHGLVKYPQATQSKAVRNAIAMPDRLPPNEMQGRVPYPQRRHHYTWCWEERTLQVERTSSVAIFPGQLPDSHVTSSPTSAMPQVRIGYGGRRGGFGRASHGGPALRIPPGRQYGPIDRPYSWSLDDVYKAHGYDPPPRLTTRQPIASRTPSPVRRVTQVTTYIPRQDPNLVYRLVGFSEYANALQCFSGLYQQCDPAELAAMDEIIREREEFEIEVNLSQRLNQPHGPLAPLMPANDNSKRRGLYWISALARVEVAAALYAFAAQSDAFERFVHEEDGECYAALVFDGARFHYWSMQNDHQLPLVLAGRSDAKQTLARLRQQLVAEGLVRATASLQAKRFNEAQLAELTRWDASLDRVKEMLVGRLANFHTRYVSD
jgi:hypothetical protein